MVHRFDTWLIKNFKDSEGPIGDVARYFNEKTPVTRRRFGFTGYENYTSFKRTRGWSGNKIKDATSFTQMPPEIYNNFIQAYSMYAIYYLTEKRPKC